jgi:hypothetical protein
VKVFKFDRRTRRVGAQLVDIPVPARLENPDEVRAPLPESGEDVDWTLATHAYAAGGQRFLFRGAVVFCTSQAGGMWRWVLLLPANENHKVEHLYSGVDQYGDAFRGVYAFSDKRALEVAAHAVMLVDEGPVKR